MNTFLKVTSRLYRGCYKAFWRIQNALTKNEVDEKHFGFNEIITAGEMLGMKVSSIDNYIYKFEYQEQFHFFTKDMCVDVESAFAYKITGNKYFTYEILRESNFNYLPNYKVYTQQMVKKAYADFEKINHGVVVKPLKDTSGGLGVSVNIRNIKEFKKAIRMSLLFCDSFIVEDFIEGESFRLTFYAGHLLSACKRIPATVIGDGKHTIRQLIKIENSKRIMQSNIIDLSLIEVDNDIKLTLKDKSMTLNSIPNSDESVAIRRLSNASAGGTTVDVMDVVSQSIIKDCQQVLESLKVVLGGVDIIATDISRPFEETGAIINEVNTSPGVSSRIASNQESELSTLLLKKMFEIS